MPDVFAFAILPTGDVIPMGIAEYDAKFYLHEFRIEK